MLNLRNNLHTVFGDSVTSDTEQYIQNNGYFKCSMQQKIAGYVKTISALTNGRLEFGEDIQNCQFLESIDKLTKDIDFTELRENYNTDSASFYHILIVNLLSSVIGYNIWNEYSKKIFKFDKCFAKHFSKTKQLKLDPIQLTHLPFNCFVLDLSDTEERNNSEIIGLLITVLPSNENSINEPIIITFQFLRQEDSDYIGTRTPYYVWLNPENLIYENGNVYYDFDSEISKRLTKLNDINDTFVSDSVIDDFVTIGLNFLSYLSCAKPDITETPQTRKQRERFERMKKLVNKVEEYNVGVRFGKAFSMYEDKVNKDYDEHKHSENGHKSPKPHLVSAHWHGYWTGEGRANWEYLWIAPYFKGYDKCELDTVIHDCVEFNKPKYSKGEELLYYLLEQDKYTVTRQKYVPSIGKRYDCSVNIDGTDVYIEFDGQQHFRPVKNWNYDATKQSDEVKNQYCKEHNIPLVRIRYDQMIIMDDILNDMKKNYKNYTEKLNPYMTDEEYYSIRK